MLETKIAAKFPEIRTPLPGPKAREIVARDERVISQSFTRNYPLVVKRGSGAMVEDVDGNLFLDFAAGIAVCATGHAHPEVVAAIQKQAAELIHMSGTDFYYEIMVQLAEKLGSITPGRQPKRVFFTNSGTEAIEAAMKLARYVTGRHRFLAFTGCFHGRTFGSLSLTSSKVVQRKGFGPLLPGVTHVPYAYCYRCPFGKSSSDCCLECLHLIEHLFRTAVPPDEVAAVFVEPIQGEGGYIVPPAGFLQGLEKICRQHQILLVADEVQCGMGRTGKWWASEHFGVEPDIICVAKGIASGMPLGAMIAPAELMRWGAGSHATTFGGNPVCLAAALATIRLIEQQYLANARRMGDLIMSWLEDWPSRHRIVGEVRGKGLMIGIEIVRDQKTREMAPELRDQIVRKAFERGLLVLGCGPSTFRMMPPLLIDRDQAQFAVELLDGIFSEVAAAA